MAEGDTHIEVRVSCIRLEADDIISVELEAPDKSRLPSFEPGAHIDLHLPNSMSRSYSLIGSVKDKTRYIIAVARDLHSRGGSRFIHERLRPGQIIPISAPRNHFQFNESASRSFFLAGGIGITPIWSMVQRSALLGRNWELHYCARSRNRAAFLNELELARGPNDLVQTHFDDESDGSFLDIHALIDALDLDVHTYCCGPQSMLAAFETAAAGRKPETVHIEYFSAKNSPDTDGGFTVILARSGREIPIPAGQTILDALIAAGIDTPYSCREGVCGTCELGVVDGVPQHRDSVLTNSERLANKTIMICCSGSKSPRITLDI